MAKRIIYTEESFDIKDVRICVEFFHRYKRRR